MALPHTCKSAPLNERADTRGAMRTSACADITASIFLYFPSTLEAARPGTFEPAGIEFIDENGGGPGVRLRKRQRLKKPK